MWRSQAGVAKPRHCMVNGPTTKSPRRARREPLYEDFEPLLVTNGTGKGRNQPTGLSSWHARHPHCYIPGAELKGDEWQAEAARLGGASHPFQTQVSHGLLEQRLQPISSPQAFCTCSWEQPSNVQAGEPRT